MLYTVKKLANLSGVTARTLRHYDEIDLLRPAYYGENKYRYYGEKELLLLQQILFYRELGFPLNEIKRIVHAEDFDKIKALQSHKAMLDKHLEKTQTLLKTIDKTIQHLRGKQIMKDEELYYGFDSEKQKNYEKFLVDSGKVSQDLINQSRNKVKHWKDADWKKCKEEGEQLYQALAEAFENKLDPGSDTVQKLIRKQYESVKVFWTPTKESYIGLGQLYKEHPDFHTFYSQFSQDADGFIDFLGKGMKIFADRELD